MDSAGEHFDSELLGEESPYTSELRDKLAKADDQFRQIRELMSKIFSR